MVNGTLTLWGNGAVTLPKEWREQYGTKHFMAIETSAGLLIRPILEVEYYENSPTDFGLHFPMGMEPQRFLKLMDAAEKELKTEKRRKTRKSHRNTHG
ncbi:MAG: AbrB/MazE/SpoVT family DNA-binding domain-containing protein [Candidatus Peribacteraceae bacterium]|jgi:bifunctional DNA-binding transcriptional regulator/antitoxin component of YhaV-PrlF toxin-antitoxin module|nr:AbrB/MazE/SpoVT family DNA-binding domain-containing protein [Candidatus Peribacteraceae bacterium]